MRVILSLSLPLAFPSIKKLLIVGVPTFAILHDSSTNGRYIGMCLLVWSFPMTNVGLIFVPKMYAVYQDRHSRGSAPQPPRGSTTPVRVTGLEDATNGDRTENENQSESASPLPATGEFSRCQVVVML